MSGLDLRNRKELASRDGIGKVSPETKEFRELGVS